MEYDKDYDDGYRGHSEGSDTFMYPHEIPEVQHDDKLSTHVMNPEEERDAELARRINDVRLCKKNLYAYQNKAEQGSEYFKDLSHEGEKTLKLAKNELKDYVNKEYGGTFQMDESLEDTVPDHRTSSDNSETVQTDDSANGSGLSEDSNLGSTNN